MCKYYAILDYANVSILLCYLEYKWKMYFFITDMHASDGQNNGLVTRKLYTIGFLINLVTCTYV
jgi:hypothetical protein